MKKNLLFISGILVSLTTFAKDFDYNFEGQTLTYTVLDNNTVATKAGLISYPDDNSIEFEFSAGNKVSGNLIIPPTVIDEDGTEYSVVEIGNYGFANCEKLTSVSLPESLEVIKNYAFYGCSGLTTITIPNSVTTIGQFAFYGCTRATSVQMPEFLTRIEMYTFTRCHGLTKVYIPESVTYIGISAFAFCTGLKSVKLPDSVNEIHGRAFNGCSGVTSLYIPESVEHIVSQAFGCKNLISVYYAAKEPLTDNSMEYLDIFEGFDDNGSDYPIGDDFYYVYDNNATLYVPAEAVEKCREVIPWNKFRNIQAFDFSDVEEISVDIDTNLPYEIYNLHGIKVSDSTDGLATGLYFIRQGNSVKKIAVK